MFRKSGSAVIEGAAVALSLTGHEVVMFREPMEALNAFETAQFEILITRARFPVGQLNGVASLKLSSLPSAQTESRWIRCQPVQACAGPIVSAIFAPRLPSGFGAPTVLSRAVWCSISALSLAPSRTTIIDTHIQVIKPMIAPSEP